MDILDFDKRLKLFVEYFAVELRVPVEAMWSAVLCRSSDQVKAIRAEWERDKTTTDPDGEAYVGSDLPS